MDGRLPTAPPGEELPWDRVRLSVVIPVFNEVATVFSAPDTYL